MKTLTEQAARVLKSATEITNAARLDLADARQRIPRAIVEIERIELAAKDKTLGDFCATARGHLASLAQVGEYSSVFASNVEKLQQRAAQIID